MTSELSIPKESREIYSKYLKYKINDAFMFGKGTFTDNQWVWVPLDRDRYSSAEIISTSGQNITVRTAEGNELTLDKSKAEFMNPPKFDGVEDCAELSYLNEPAVLHNLRKRYDADVIYVSNYLPFCV
jgi:myosin heavy subunit